MRRSEVVRSVVNSAIDFASVASFDHEYDQAAIVESNYYPPIADTVAPISRKVTGQGFATEAGVGQQGDFAHSLGDSDRGIASQFRQCLFGILAKLNAPGQGAS